MIDLEGGSMDVDTLNQSQRHDDVSNDNNESHHGDANDADDSPPPSPVAEVKKKTARKRWVFWDIFHSKFLCLYNLKDNWSFKCSYHLASWCQVVNIISKRPIP